MKSTKNTKNTSVKSKKSGDSILKGNPLLFNKKGESRIYLFLAFIIPFIIMWYFFSKSEIYPFGTKQILVTDLWHQYYPFFRIEHEKLQDFSSLFYSWDTGLGTNFISLMSYYTASPLNFLAFLFPMEYSREALTLFLTLKISCAGLFFAIFVKHVFKKNDISITAFGLCYALCNYIMGYYWNVIWIDTVALLPLVVLGTIKLYKEGKFKLYVISLALSLMSSFYIGLFTCIFTVLIFGGLVICEWGGIKYAAKRLGQIAGASAIGIGIGALILLPAFLGLMLTNSTENKFPETITYYETWTRMLSAILGFQAPTVKEGLPNYYCGMVAVALLGIFIRAKSVKIREKVVTVIYLAFIVVSCNMNVLNYIWHGFHFTNMLPYRFSFLFSFLVLAAGYRAFTVMKAEKNKFDIIAAAVMTFVIALVTYGEKTEENPNALTYSLIVCFIFIVITALYELNIVKEKLLNFLVFGVCFVEMGMNASLGVESVSNTSRDQYPTKGEEIQALIDTIEMNDDGFYRIEKNKTYTINDPALYGYKGISQFSSTANVNVTNLMRSLGVPASAAGNRYYYHQNTAVVNMFLNLKYLLSIDNYSGDLTYLEPLAESNGVSSYKNTHHLPIGFMSENTILDFTGESTNQFNNQNELFRLATGIEEDVLVKVPIKDVGHTGLNVIKTGDGQYNYQYEASESGNCFLKYNYEVMFDGPVYFSFDFGTADSVNTVQIKNGNAVLYTKKTDKYLATYAAADMKAGETVTFQANVPENESGNGTIFVYQINSAVFEEGYQKLLEGSLDVTEYDDTYICGNMTAAEDGVMYTSIPYDSGWSVYVDGKEAETSSINDAFLCAHVPAGEHRIELKYCPPGFVPGLIISIVSLGAFAALWYLSGRLTKKKEAVSAETAKVTEEENEKS